MAANDKPDEWVVIDYVRWVVGDICAQLRRGAKGEGVTLTLSADECTKLLGCLKLPAWPKGRPPGDWTRAYAIAVRCHDLERGGLPRKAAIAETAKQFGCSTKTVRNAIEPRAANKS